MLYKHLVHPLEDKLYCQLNGEWKLLFHEDFMSDSDDIMPKLEGMMFISSRDIGNDWAEYLYTDSQSPNQQESN